MNVNDVIAAQIEQARRKIQADRERRAQLAAARRRGLGARHSQKLRSQASARTTDGTVSITPTETNTTEETL